MRTNTPAAKAATAKKTTTTKAPAAPRKPSFEVSSFTVTERWVRISAKILAEHAEVFLKTSEFHKNGIFRGYSASMFIALSAFQRTGKRSVGWWDIRQDGTRYHADALLFKKRAEIQFSVTEADWLRFSEFCDSFGSTPAEMICAAFGTRATSAGIPGHREKAKDGGAA